MSLFTRSRQLPATTGGEAEADGGGATGEGVTEEVVEEAGAAETARAVETVELLETSSRSGRVAPPRPGWFGWRRRYPRTARGVSVATSVLAGLLLLVVLLSARPARPHGPPGVPAAPRRGDRPGGRPAVLPPKAPDRGGGLRRCSLGLLTLLKLMDMGFRQTLARPFDLVFDWIMLGNATDWLQGVVRPHGRGARDRPG